MCVKLKVLEYTLFWPGCHMVCDSWQSYELYGWKCDLLFCKENGIGAMTNRVEGLNPSFQMVVPDLRVLCSGEGILSVKWNIFRFIPVNFFIRKSSTWAPVVHNRHFEGSTHILCIAYVISKTHQSFLTPNIIWTEVNYYRTNKMACSRLCRWQVLVDTINMHFLLIFLLTHQTFFILAFHLLPGLLTRIVSSQLECKNSF